MAVLGDRRFQRRGHGKRGNSLRRHRLRAEGAPGAQISQLAGDPLMAIPDRLELLLGQTAVTGIDFVYVYPSQTTLDVYFLNSPVAIQGAVAPKDIRIYSPSGGESLPVVPVVSVSWQV